MKLSPLTIIYTRWFYTSLACWNTRCNTSQTPPYVTLSVIGLWTEVLILPITGIGGALYDALDHQWIDMPMGPGQNLYYSPGSYVHNALQ